LNIGMVDLVVHRRRVMQGQPLRLDMEGDLLLLLLLLPLLHDMVVGLRMLVRLLLRGMAVELLMLDRVAMGLLLLHRRHDMEVVCLLGLLGAKEGTGHL
jgi:hypothetical protein